MFSCHCQLINLHVFPDSLSEEKRIEEADSLSEEETNIGGRVVAWARDEWGGGGAE